MLRVKADRNIKDRDMRLGKLIYEWKNKVYNTKLILELYDRKFYKSKGSKRKEQISKAKYTQQYTRTHEDELKID